MAFGSFDYGKGVGIDPTYFMDRPRRRDVEPASSQERRRHLSVVDAGPGDVAVADTVEVSSGFAETAEDREVIRRTIGLAWAYGRPRGSDRSGL